MATGAERLASIETGLAAVSKEVGDVKSDVKGMRSEIGEVKEGMASIKRTVELLVEGRIKQDKQGTSDSENSKHWSKATMVSLEIVRTLVAAVIGFAAGKGGGN